MRARGYVRHGPSPRVTLVPLRICPMPWCTARPRRARLARMGPFVVHIVQIHRPTSLGAGLPHGTLSFLRSCAKPREKSLITQNVPLPASARFNWVQPSFPPVRRRRGPLAPLFLRLLSDNSAHCIVLCGHMTGRKERENYIYARAICARPGSKTAPTCGAGDQAIHAIQRLPQSDSQRTPRVPRPSLSTETIAVMRAWKAPRSYSGGERGGCSGIYIPGAQSFRE